ncbi:hypothetical protein [Leuconostoc citreum]|uniref:hypothetical protein n=1 Tax=Leuconostoc citreum TaxID=33964 RepID=UPI000BFED1A4|nr:hypothetical protein [Leuconostoc citreum]
MGKYIRYKLAKEKIQDIEHRPENFVLIHCATSSIFGESYPNISCISLMNIKDKERTQFSLAKYPLIDSIEKKELKLLTDFFEYVESVKKYCTFIHWNMNSQYYGFAAIEMRYNLLSRKPNNIFREIKKMDLDDILGNIYSNEYVDNPKMYNLYTLNNFHINNFSDGETDAKNYEQRNWYNIEKSSRAKVEFIYQVLELTAQNKLKVQNKYLNDRIIFTDKILYFVKETILGRFIFWFLVTIFGALIGSIFDHLLFS